MGYLNVSSRIAVLSLGLLALASCQDAAQTPTRAAQASVEETEIVICPGDRRCGEMQPAPAVPATTCRLEQSQLRFKCGAQALPCPGEGCPTGEPGLPAQDCRISEAFVEAKCRKSSEMGTAGDSEAAAAAASPQPATPAETAAE